MKCRILLLACLLWTGGGYAQSADKVLDSPDPTTNPIHKARKGIKILQGYTYTGTNARYYINETEALPTTYASNQNSSLSTTLNKSLDIGSVNGQASVSLGSASYTVQLALPQASGNFLPQLQLVYTHNGPNGILGIGWAVSGLSAITRMNSDLLHDPWTNPVKMTSGDALGLDGSRMYLTAASTYKTENEDFSVIRSFGNFGNKPEWFRIITKDGLEYEYGNTADSRLLNNGLTEVLSWRVNKIKDSHGNYITFKYYGNRDTRIDEIAYGGNASISPINMIKFLYDQRTDKNTTYSGGASMVHEHLLRSIKVTTQGMVYSRYEFAFGSDNIYSYLTGITEISSGDRKQKNSTRFKYESQPVAFQTSTAFVAAANSDPLTGDFNGDGYADMVEAFRFTGTYSQIRVHLWNPATSSYNLAITHPLSGADNQVYIGNEGKVYTDKKSVQSMDYNGDGLDDIVIYSAKPPNHVAGTAGNHYNFKVLYTNASVTAFSEVVYNRPAGYDFIPVSMQFPYLMRGDFDGDSRPDILYFLSTTFNGAVKGFISQPGAGLTNLQITDVPVSGVTSFGSITSADQVLIVDHDGDGKSEVMVIRGGNCTTYEIYEAAGNYYAKAIYSGGYPTAGHNILTGDFNGDGKTDLYTYVKSGGYQEIAYSRGNGDGYVTTPFTTLNTVSLSDLGMTDYIIIADYNADGKSDLVHAKHINSTSSLTDIYYSRGTSFKGSSHVFNQWIDPLGFSFIPCDIDGDGRMNLYYPYTTTPHVVSFMKNGKERFLSQVFDGNGQLSTFTYKKINEDAAFYTKGSGAAFPMMDYKGALYAVNSFSWYDGTGGTLQTDYQYAGAKVHRQGRGLTGFTSVTETNVWLRRKIVNEFELNTTFAIMLPKKNRITIHPSGALISEDVNTNQVVPVDVMIANRFFIKVTGVTHTDGLTGNITTTSHTHDASGNITNTTTSIAGVETKTVARSNFAAVSPSVVLSQPQLVTTTQARTGETAYSSTKRYIYNTTGSIQSSVDFDGLAKSVTTGYTYDNAGNVLTTTITASGVATQTETNEYDATKRFLVRHKNTFNQQSAYEYDPLLGLQVKETMPDGQTVSHKYDSWGKEIEQVNALGVKCTTVYGWVNSGDIVSGTSIFNAGSQALTYQLKTPVGSAPLKTYFDMLHRVVRTENTGLNNEKIYYEAGYDASGNLVWSSSPYKAAALNDAIQKIDGHDFYNRLSFSITENYGSTFSNMTLYSYSHAGGNTTIAVTAPDNTITTKQYDAAGRLIQVNDDGGTLDYTYYSHGGIRQVNLNGDLTASMEYDIYARQNKLTDKDAGVTLFEYDPLGRLKAQTDANNYTFTTTYDALDRITQRATPSGTYTYAYVTSGYGLNKLQWMSEPNGDVMEYSYDQYARLVWESKSITGQQYLEKWYDYDANGRLVLETYPDGFSVSSEYDANGHLKKMVRGDNGDLIWEALTANGIAAVTSYKLGNNATTNNSYHPLGYLDQSMTSGIQGFRYEYNILNGNMDIRTNLSNMQNEYFTYDATGRLELAGSTGANYNPKGNIMSKTDIGNFTYDAVKTDAVISVDNLGAVSTETQVVIYTPFNKPETIEEGDYVLTYAYGADEHRSRGVMTHAGNHAYTRYYFGNYELQEKDGNTTGIVYITSPSGLCAMYVNENGSQDMYYVYTDHLGSITTVTDGAQAVVATQSFTAWGLKRNPANWTMSGIPSVPDWLYRGYTGHEMLPEFALVNMNARLYDPVLGMMLTPDSYIQLPDNTQSYNRYAYCLNNPLKYNDPTGEIFWTPIIIAAAILAGAYTNTAAVEGTYNPTKWKFNDKTWGAMIEGGVKAGVATGLGIATGQMFALSGLPFGKLASGLSQAYVESGGRMLEFGPFSYDIEKGKFKSLHSWKDNGLMKNMKYLLKTTKLIDKGLSKLGVKGPMSLTDKYVLDPIKSGISGMLDANSVMGQMYNNMFSGGKSSSGFGPMDLIGALQTSISPGMDYEAELKRYNAAVFPASFSADYASPDFFEGAFNAPHASPYAIVYQQQMSRGAALFNLKGNR